MSKAEMNKELTEAMRDFSAAYSVLRVAIDRYEQQTGTSVNDLKDFTERYPFDKSFDELEVGQWVANVVEGLHQPAFKVVGHQYLNTGGNTMVGIFDVWLPEEKKVVYVYTNEEGCTMSTVDYIRLDLDIDNYDELMVDYIDWGRATGHEKYFELYRYCLNVNTKDDCRHFGITRGLPYHLLSEALQQNVDADYLAYCEAEHGGLIDTDGYKIVVYPDYESDAAVDNDAEALQYIKNWKEWHDTLPGDDTLEKMYDEYYRITLAGKAVLIPFDANAFSIIDELLKETIKEW